MHGVAIDSYICPIRCGKNRVRIFSKLYGAVLYTAIDSILMLIMTIIGDNARTNCFVCQQIMVFHQFLQFTTVFDQR